VGEGGQHGSGARPAMRSSGAAVEARRGWCSSRGGWKMRAGITAGVWSGCSQRLL
jgi:hypothetical protein